MLFAISLDTVSLALMIALSGSAAGGPAHALLLGAVFGAGMVLTDGANGWWLARLLAHTGGHAAARASRLTAAAVGTLSLAVATLGALRWAWPAADLWTDGIGAWLGAALLLAMLLACAWLLRRAEPGPDFRPPSENAIGS